MTITRTLICVLPSLALLGPYAFAAPLDTSFTFQGKIVLDGADYDGLADLDFSLWDADVDGLQIGATIQLIDVTVTEGLFTVDLDFGDDAFLGDKVWLEMSVNGSPLSPRQPIAAAPYATHSENTRGIEVDDLGNVGIGIDTPAAPLDVDGTVNATAFVGDGSGLTNLPQAAALWQENGADIYYPTGHVGVGTSDTTLALSIANGGEPVGITQGASTGSPNAMQLVTTDSIGNPATRMVIEGLDDNADIALYAGAAGAEAQTMVIDGATGNVGIGTDTPAATLDVAGDAHVSGQMTSDTGWFGTKTDTPVELYVNDTRAMRFEYAEVDATPAPNFIGGHLDNAVTSGGGAVIAGGGGDLAVNQVSGDWGTVSGGKANTAHNRGAIGGGEGNTTGKGGWGTVSGGMNNTAIGAYSSVPGGFNNTAAGDYSFALGRQATANHDGSFVWSDSSGAFTSTGANQFLIDADGGVGIGTTSPGGPLQIQGRSGEPSQGQIHIVGNGEGGPGDAYISFWEGSETIGSEWSVGARDNNDVFAISKGFTMDADPKFAINDSGNVGIGTTAPSESLDVKGDVLIGGGSSFDGAAESLTIRSRASDWTFNVETNISGNDMTINSSDFGEVMRLDSTGTVGIGTASPSAKLDVVGTTELNGTVDVNGNLDVSGLITSAGQNMKIRRGKIQAGDPGEVLGHGGVWLKCCYNYGTTFASPPVVMLTIEWESGVGNSNIMGGVVAYTRDVSTTSFGWYLRNTMSGTLVELSEVTVSWIAIGN